MEEYMSYFKMTRKERVVKATLKLAKKQSK